MHPESNFFGVTVRGWLAVLITLTVCIMSLLKIEIKEPLYSGFLTALAFYLGTKTGMMMSQNKEQNLEQKP